MQLRDAAFERPLELALGTVVEATTSSNGVEVAARALSDDDASIVATVRACALVPAPAPPEAPEGLEATATDTVYSQLAAAGLPYGPRFRVLRDVQVPRVLECNAQALYRDVSSTLADISEAVTTLEVVEPTARRVFGGAHPVTRGIETSLRKARAALRARETPGSA